MDLDQSEARFAEYVAGLGSAIGHAERRVRVPADRDHRFQAIVITHSRVSLITISNRS